eukprot:UN09157
MAIGGLPLGAIVCVKKKIKLRVSKYVLIFNMETHQFYVIEESKSGNWKLTGIFGSKVLKSISTTSRKVTTNRIFSSEDAYVIIQLKNRKKFRMNRKSASIEAVKHFVDSIDRYLEAIESKKLVDESVILASINQKINDGDEALRTIIRTLQCSNDTETKKKGMTLGYWYEIKKEIILKEFIDLLQQNVDELTDGDIIKIMMLKCETLQIIKGNQATNDIVIEVEK